MALQGIVVQRAIRRPGMAGEHKAAGRRNVRERRADWHLRGGLLEGTRLQQSTDRTIIGEWSRGLAHGTGFEKLVHPNQVEETYFGTFFEGQRQGVGILYERYASTDTEVLEGVFGHFKKGEINGIAVPLRGKKLPTEQSATHRDGVASGITLPSKIYDLSKMFCKYDVLKFLAPIVESAAESKIILEARFSELQEQMLPFGEAIEKETKLLLEGCETMEKFYAALKEQREQAFGDFSQKIEQAGYDLLESREERSSQTAL